MPRCEEFSASEMTVNDLLAAVSPSLFGGGRVVVVRDAQDAKKDLAAAILSYAASPEPDVVLVVTHAGGAKGKALADGLREAGASVVSAAKLTRARERVDFVRDEIRRLGGKASEEAAEALHRRGRQRPARAGRRLLAARRRHRRPDRRRPRSRGTTGGGPR